MKAFGGILAVCIILLSLSQGESHFVKPWHFCKTKEVTDPPTPCSALECSGLCGSLYTGGVGICIAESCECLHSCFKEAPPSSDAMPVSDDKAPQMAWSSPSSKDFKPDRISRMTSSPSMENLKRERRSKAAALSSSMENLKPERQHSEAALSSSIEQPENISKVALSSSSKDLKQTERISKVDSSSSMDLKHESSKVASSSSKDQLTSDRVSKVTLTSPMVPINKPDRISNLGWPIKP